MLYVHGEDTLDSDASVSDRLVKHVYWLFKNIQTSGLGVWLFISRHTIVAGYYGFTLVVRESVRLSVRPSYVRPSVRFSFPDDNLSKHQWIFTKLGMCIDIVEIWFGIANGQISSISDGVICPRHAHIFVSGL